MARVIDLRKLKKVRRLAEEDPPKQVLETPVLEEAPTNPAPEPETTLREAEPAQSPPHFEWEAPSFRYNPQKKYLALIVLALVVGAVALLFYKQDLLFAIFLMLSSLVLVLYSNKKPDIFKIKIDQTGISIDNIVYGYKELKSFWIDYNPQGLKELSLHSKKWYMPYIKVSVENKNPVELRSLMVNFIPERFHEQSLIDLLARKLGL